MPLIAMSLRNFKRDNINGVDFGITFINVGRNCSVDEVVNESKRLLSRKIFSH